VTICGKGGGRSAEGADMLNKLGHPVAHWLEGGTNGWLEQNSWTPRHRNGGDPG
jgi:rhodanese-related sulfurtransferase